MPSFECKPSSPGENSSRDGSEASERESGDCSNNVHEQQDKHEEHNTNLPILRKHAEKHSLSVGTSAMERFYRTFLLSLLHGTSHGSNPRPPLPLDLLPLIIRFAHLHLPTPSLHLSLTCTARISTPVLHMAPCPYKVWFATPPLTKCALGKICGVRVRTWVADGWTNGDGHDNRSIPGGCSVCGGYGGYGGCAFRHRHGHGQGQYDEVWRMRIGMGINPRDERFGYQVAILEKGKEGKGGHDAGGKDVDEQPCWEAIEYNRSFYTHTTNLVKRRTPERGGTPLMWFSHLPIHILSLGSPGVSSSTQSVTSTSQANDPVSTYSTPSAGPHFVEGMMFGSDHEIWEWLEEGDRIALVAGWECEGRRAEMRFWTWFEL